MKFQDLQRLCRENAYSVKREGRVYVWIKNGSDDRGMCDTVLETAVEIRKHIENNNKSRKLGL